MTDVSGPPHLLPIDRNSPVPLYFQLAQQLEAAIESGEVGQGKRLDNELQLAAQLGLSRPTVRRAIQYLVDKGLLVRRRGVGTTVVPAKVRRAVELTSLYDDLVRSGQQPTTKVLFNGTEPAGRTLAQTFGVPEGTPVAVIRRLRYASGEPIALMCNYLTVDIPGLTTPALERHGLYELIRGTGIRLRAAVQTIGARSASASEARLLDEPKRAPLLTMERTAYDDHGRAVEHGTHVYRASRYCFEQSMLGH